ncbi:gamma-butyrobetaine dioxygenase-like [Danaus plexippus]|uniref:gamma-butyrobetaine dioxygenase-like n=1 Tax=Danaus plexippus TaxID=13037 RepID=UPI002AB253BD|nr:gamma-butyrobetaine dioxygenase-like [Danaus plexippus]
MILRRLCTSKHYFRNTVNVKNVTNKFYSNDVTSKTKRDILDLNIRGETYSFPHVWLRDNCQCDQCFHKFAQSRIIDWSKFNLNSFPKDVVKDENSVRITWDDGHISQYTTNWLLFRSFNRDKQQYYDNYIYKPEKIVWHGKEFSKICTKHDYKAIVETDEALYKWLYNLSTYGVALIENTPPSEHSMESIVDRIGFKKRTHYGHNFIVQNVPNTNNVAYLSSTLQLHTDLPYYEYCPGANLLHCLVQTNSKGGENLLSDCHYTARYMKQKHPDAYKLLTEVEVEWSDIGTEQGNEFYKLHRGPVICTDKHGDITRINFSIPQRGSYLPIPIELVKPWFEAHSMFFEFNTKFSANFKTKSGDILTFDNIRLLHGRNQYKDSAENVRKLIGAYVDWDEIYSRLRCLKVKLHPENTS